METILFLAALIGALALIAQVFRPAPHPHVIVIQTEPVTAEGSSWGCLPLVALAVLVLLVLTIV